MTNCTFNKYDEQLILKLIREVESLSKDTNARLLLQDGKIAKCCTYIQENLSESLKELLEALKTSGELDDIIAHALLICYEEDKYYYPAELISTEKFTDSVTGSDYYVTRVKKRTLHEGLKLKLAIANDNLNANSLESPVDYAHRTNASLVVNGGIYNVNTHKPLGIFILDGKILNNEVLTDSKYRYLGIDKIGRLKTYTYTSTAEEMLNDGAVDVFCTFTDLVKDGQALTLSDTVNYDPRNSIGQMANGDYIIITVDGRQVENPGFRYQDLQRIFLEYGVVMAVALDGGGSASTVVRGIKQNDDIDSSFNDRAVSNFLHITKPNNFDSSLNPFNSIGWLKQRLSKISNTLINFDKGYMRLRAPEGQHHPGIEIYSNGETERSAKIGFTSADGVIRRILMSMKVDGVETNVFGATPSGLMDSRGYLAQINRKPTIVTDCNTIANTGLYRVNSATLNKAYNCNIGYIMHISMYDETDGKNGNARQIMFSKDNDLVFSRTIAENGTPADWRAFGNMKCTSSTRPEGVVGLMVFDTTIKKPIWYTTNGWVDANGNNV